MAMRGNAYTARWASLAVAAALCGGVFAGMEDSLLVFSTTGKDRYADGTVVADGECYALVWSPAGKAFSGFNADGTAVSSQDRVVLAAPLALNGRCRDSVFQIPAADYAELAGGEWAVCLVDTRTASGVPAGVADNAPRRVNRWGVVESALAIEPAAASRLGLAASKPTARTMSASSSEGTKVGACARTLSAVPDAVKPPRVTSIEVGDGAVRLAVADTVPFLTYTLSSGDSPGSLAVDSSADRVDGDAEKEIDITSDTTGRSRFFKVTRAK